MKTGHVLTLGILSFTLTLAGCGAYEQAQKAARRDLQKAEDQRQFAEDANEAIMQLGSFYVQYHRQNSKSPANLEELLSINTNTEQRAAAATETIRRMIDASEITVDWNVDLTAWQASGQDLKQYRLAWLTSKDFMLYADGAGMLRNLMAGQLMTSVGRMNEAPAAVEVASTDTTGQSQPADSTQTGQETSPAPVAAPAILTFESTPAEFVAVLKSGNQGRVLQALGLLTGQFDAKPNQQVSDAIIAVMKTGDFGVQINGANALEHWGTTSAAAELEAIVAKSGNPGLEIQTQRVVAILKARKQ